MVPWTASKKLQGSVAVPPAPLRVSSQRPHAPSVASVTFVANDKGNNEMIPGAANRSPGICLTAEENPGKPQIGDFLMKAVWLAIASNVVSYFQMTSVESHSTYGREKEGKKGKMGFVSERERESHHCTTPIRLCRHRDSISEPQSLS